jgi:mannose-1-phosphate guanylyltransferase
MAACADLGIRRFAVNTHHLAECWGNFEAPAGTSIDFFHEPTLLDTGGGLKNLEDWCADKPLLVHNGDILTTMPLRRLMETHASTGDWATLAVRREGPPHHIALDASGTKVVDIRNLLGRADGTLGFTGVYCVNPGFFQLIPEGEIISVIPAFLECARLGKLGAVIIDEGIWLDLGDRSAYLRAHRELGLAAKIHADAMIESGALVHDSVVGPGASIGSGAKLDGCVVWPGARVLEGADLKNCIVATEAAGSHQERDFA